VPFLQGVQPFQLLRQTRLCHGAFHVFKPALEALDSLLCFGGSLFAAFRLLAPAPV
jgi:hypothetical protein